MSEQDRRDLQADLAICEAATPGPVKWRRYGGPYMLEGEYGSRPIILSKTWEETAEGDVVKASIEIAVRDADGMLQPLTPDHPDARRIEESWEGWPHAIRRALEAEKRVAELVARLQALEKVAKAAINYRKAKRAMDQDSQTAAGFDAWMRYVEVEATLLAAVDEFEGVGKSGLD